MNPRLTWDGLGVGLSTSIWVIESRLSEYPASKWSVELDSEVSPDELHAKVEITKLQKLMGGGVEYRVAEYRRVEPC